MDINCFRLLSACWFVDVSNVKYKNILAIIFNEIKCHVNTSLGLVGRMHPLHPPLMSAPAHNTFCQKTHIFRLAWRCCISVGTGIFGGAKDILHKFSPNLTEKCLCDKRSPYKFSVAVHHIFHYHVAIDLKIENFVSYNLVRYKLCKNIVRKQLSQYSWASGSQFWGFPFTLQLLLSERNLRSSWGGPKAAYFSEDVYLKDVACIIIFILWLYRESHNIICSTAHICNMCSSKH